MGQDLISISLHVYLVDIIGKFSLLSLALPSSPLHTSEARYSSPSSSEMPFKREACAAVLGTLLPQSLELTVNAGLLL